MSFDFTLPDSWKAHLAPLLQEPQCQRLSQYLARRCQQNIPMYPPREDIFRAFRLTPWDQVKVVIVGQDPYHGPGQANGLAFSVSSGVALPPSLRNIYKEIQADTGSEPPVDGDLQWWARQGVLLLNRVLTVEAGKANSHRNKGWERFSEGVLRALSTQKQGVIFVLWGQPAQQLQASIDQDRHHILTAPHPSPLSAYRGFLGCGHFSRINAILQQQGQQPIDWGGSADSAQKP